MRLFWLLLYYGVARYMPDSFSRPFGKVSNALRVACCRRLFKACGAEVNIGRMAYFGKGAGVEIGDRSNIGAYCHVPSDIRIGRDVMMGPCNYFFEPVTHVFDRTDIPMIEQGVRRVKGRMEIDDDVWVGRGCHILPCRKIGAHSIVGACSVVTRDVGDYEIVGGNPARLIRNRKD